MANFADIESFIKEAKYQVEYSMKNELLPKIRETAQDILIREFYKFTPKIYDRLNLLADSILIKCSWQGDTCIGTLYISTDKHPTSNWDVFDGNVDHTFDEIINVFLVNGRSYEEKNDNGIDVLGLTQEEMVETGEAMQILYNELKKKFDIV